MKLKSHEFASPFLIAKRQKYFNKMKNNNRQKSTSRKRLVCQPISLMLIIEIYYIWIFQDQYRI